MDPETDLDLAAFVAEALPSMVAAEAAQEWAAGHSRPPRPATDLAAEDGPLAAYLRLPAEPPEDADRAGRAAFWEDRREAEQAARDEARYAVTEHDGWQRTVERERVADTFFAQVNTKSSDSEQGQRTAKGPDLPTFPGWW